VAQSSAEVRAQPTAELLPYFPQPLQEVLARVPSEILTSLTEIRLRVGGSLAVTVDSRQYFVDPSGRLTVEAAQGVSVTRELFTETLERITQGSLYALERELREGYLTLPGGHRVGIAGRVVWENGACKTLKHISSLNFRVARELPGAADKLMPYVRRPGQLLPRNTLLYSGPGAGKTTLLRDIARQLSYGDPQRGIPGLAVGIVDERSELAASYRGVPAHDVGPRTDVLDACPKAQGMIMMLRSMGPQVLVTDEIGRREEAVAIQDALASGVSVITSAHASSLDELRARPVLAELMRAGVFECLVRLSRFPRPGTLVAVTDGEGRPLVGERAEAAC